MPRAAMRVWSGGGRCRRAALRLYAQDNSGTQPSHRMRFTDLLISLPGRRVYIEVPDEHNRHWRVVVQPSCEQ